MAPGAVKSFQRQCRVLFLQLHLHFPTPAIAVGDTSSHHLHCNSSGSPHLLKESRNEPAPRNQSFANIFTEEKSRFLHQGELNLSRYWLSRNCWSVINRLDSLASMLIPGWPCNLLLHNKIYLILKIKFLSQNKIIDHVLTLFILLMFCISFLVHVLFLKQQIFTVYKIVYLFYTFPDQSQIGL